MQCFGSCGYVTLVVQSITAIVHDQVAVFVEGNSGILGGHKRGEEGEERRKRDNNKKVSGSTKIVCNKNLSQSIHQSILP
ncbi:uncharacterized protein BO97DRAFT_407452 [Aspergillus homomorphus CBS 101889]|uniref:Uncharacterized protein n=1 Tax=Aspergillus homomorphus (strain CBS 101889) TaxID=1450537 RepID=A0A395HP05_ASPHC|nr:hypothetical protein BO97DRAFT_407452 [Aspergillus homomorphus CBS 101889]RAL09692.1 hypothetical protein BO97DRAFT_407452 [Aspergillus homomorphus CBS 101889]